MKKTTTKLLSLCLCTALAVSGISLTARAPSYTAPINRIHRKKRCSPLPLRKPPPQRMKRFTFSQVRTEPYRKSSSATGSRISLEARPCRTKPI